MLTVLFFVNDQIDSDFVLNCVQHKQDVKSALLACVRYYWLGCKQYRLTGVVDKQQYVVSAQRLLCSCINKCTFTVIIVGGVQYSLSHILSISSSDAAADPPRRNRK